MDFLFPCNDFCNSIPKFSQSVCAAADISSCVEVECCVQGPLFLNCAIDMILIYLFLLFLLIKVLYLLKKDRTKISLRYAVQQSIFSYLGENSYKAYLFYFVMAYAIFFGRPLTGVITNSLFVNYAEDNCSNVISILSYIIFSIARTVSFFGFVFMIYFYGIKVEILYVKGELTINPSERKAFLNMVIYRSLSVSMFYLIAELIQPFIGGSYYSQQINSKEYEYFLDDMRNIFLLILAVARLSYVRYAGKMTKFKTSSQKRLYEIISFNKHVEDHLIWPDQLPALIAEAKDGDNFLSSFQNILEKKTQQSLFLYNEKIKIVSDGSTNYQPLIRNSMENHLAGSIWLFLSVLDLAVNSICYLFTTVLALVPPSNTATNIKIVIGYFTLVCYILEVTVLAGLTYYIISSKVNYGEHLEMDLSFNKISSRTASLNREDRRSFVDSLIGRFDKH